MIYFARLESGSIKIGCSEDVELRLKTLALEYSTRLTLLATMHGDARRERELHRRFAHLRLGVTEQFKPDRELMEFIGVPYAEAAGMTEMSAGPKTKRGRTGVYLHQADIDRVGAIRATLQEGTSFNGTIRECIKREHDRSVMGARNGDPERNPQSPS